MHTAIIYMQTMSSVGIAPDAVAILSLAASLASLLVNGGTAVWEFRKHHDQQGTAVPCCCGCMQHPTNANGACLAFDHECVRLREGVYVRARARVCSFACMGFRVLPGTQLVPPLARQPPFCRIAFSSSTNIA